MIHPCLATMLAVVTTDYPLARGRGGCVPAPRGRAVLQPHLRRRRLLDERRRGAARERSVAVSPSRPGTGRAVLPPPRRGLRGSRAADRRRRRGATVVLEIGVSSASSQEEAEAIALPRRDLAARQDRRLRARPQLGPRAGRGRLGALERRVRPARPRPAAGRLRRHAGVRRGCADRLRSRSWRAHPAGSSSTSGSVTARPPTWHPTSPTTTSGSTRSTRRDRRREAGRPRRRGSRPSRARRGRR